MCSLVKCYDQQIRNIFTALYFTYKRHVNFINLIWSNHIKELVYKIFFLEAYQVKMDFNNYVYTAEYAKTNYSQCNICNRNISDGLVKIAQVTVVS